MENLSMKCEKDCWACELEGCPYTLDISDEVDELAKKKTPIEVKRKLWMKSERGRECNRKGQQNYRKRHPQKYNKDHARHEWIKDNTKRKGVRPTDAEIQAWSDRYDLRHKRELKNA